VFHSVKRRKFAGWWSRHWPWTVYNERCSRRNKRYKIFFLSSATLYINYKSYLLLFIYLTTCFDPTRGHLQWEKEQKVRQEGGSGERRSIKLLEGSQASPSRPSDSNILKMRVRVKILEKWQKWFGIGDPELWFVVDTEGWGKRKTIPLQAWTDPEGSRRLRLPDYKTVGTWRWQGCQPYAPAAFTPRKYSWFSFLLEAESTPGP